MSTVSIGSRWRKQVQDFLTSIGYGTTFTTWGHAGDDITARGHGHVLSVEAKHQARVSVPAFIALALIPPPVTIFYGPDLEARQSMTHAVSNANNQHERRRTMHVLTISVRPAGQPQRNATAIDLNDQEARDLLGYVNTEPGEATRCAPLTRTLTLDRFGITLRLAPCPKGCPCQYEAWAGPTEPGPRPVHHVATADGCQCGEHRREGQR